MPACHITTFLQNVETKRKLVSLELCSNRPIDINKVTKIDPPFCFVTWLQSTVTNFGKHPAILLSQQLVENGLNIVIHLPGRIYSQHEMMEILTIIKNIGITNILVVRGERALGESKSDFPFAHNLVAYVKQHFDNYFCIGVAGYPSGHPSSASLQEDLNYLKQKVYAGADFIVTQAIFDVQTFCNFYRSCVEHNITVPILPGLFIISSYSSLMNVVKFCKISLPSHVSEFMEKQKANKDIIEAYGISNVVEIAEHLLKSNNVVIKCVHIFTLNDLDTVEKILNKLK